ncbi:hypothetical protein M0D70_01670 [Acinetobacter portensis]|uniref:Uncharacterized protein n=2 Tax=Acinetobacter TaxID=469 RepID=A0AB35UR68_9GAMM|nr:MULTISPECIES: hypothetical protein [Acinetobacter]MCK7608145.1 hypothetical protein [Acinetobacter portensis]MCK7638889.1 hypothetical protein [Acinetobacter portensis]MDY6485569.1 hypothetical protein [Acinetobacter faecalis]MDY6486281.1 hypothetical protein [Acinetobacter faecalis]MDY6489044.1 hypothetical protein [Acinetobacter faecalis]
MVLYKYVGFEAGLKILKTNTLGFSHLEDFNDPFEATALALVEDNFLFLYKQELSEIGCRENMLFYL